MPSTLLRDAINRSAAFMTKNVTNWQDEYRQGRKGFWWIRWLKARLQRAISKRQADDLCRSSSTPGGVEKVQQCTHWQGLITLNGLFCLFSTLWAPEQDPQNAFCPQVGLLAVWLQFKQPALCPSGGSRTRNEPLLQPLHGGCSEPGLRCLCVTAPPAPLTHFTAHLLAAA